MQVKWFTAVVRLLFNLVIVLALFHNEQLMQRVCGPFTLAPAPRAHLLTLIIVMELLRALYPLLVAAIERMPLLRENLLFWLKPMTSVKYLMVLLLKFMIILNEPHRHKYYLHSMLLEITIILVAVLMDCFRRENITEAGDLLLLEGLYRLALVYEVTQTFCPNLILYYSITNFLVFIISQIEGQVKYGLSSSLYVKNDIYRFLCVSFAYFSITAVAQLSYSYNTLIVYVCVSKFYVSAVRKYKEGEFKSALKSCLLVAAIMLGLEVGFIYVGNVLEGGVS